jgi:serine/threonine protein kinase
MIGKKLGNWVIDAELGRGGMGRVYLAHEDISEAPTSPGETPNSPPRQAAIKILSPDLAQETGFLRRFQREIDALSLLSHPNIVRFYDSGAVEGNYYYAMEYIAGRNFDELLHENGRLPWKEVLDLALQVCPALKHAHDHGIIHRDIKPPNLLRTDAGVVKLTDFGIAKVFAGKQLTAANTLVGTAEYLSPEQAAGKPVTNRSDLYSLGIVLYTLLVGHPPFEGESVLDLLHKHRFSQFDPPDKMVPGIPHDFSEVICQLLEKDPAKRPHDGLVLQRLLERVRRKFERKEQYTVIRPLGETQAETEEVEEEEEEEDSPGPATLMSRLMRQELTSQKQGGPVTQFLNRPIVIISLLLICIGVITWKAWPRSKTDPAALFEQGAALMASDDPADWNRAWTEYLEPLDRQQLDPQQQEELDRFRQLINDHDARRRAVSRTSDSASEAQHFYDLGQRLCLAGDQIGARRVWENLVRSFDGVEAEAFWVRLAKQGLADLESQAPAEHRWDSVHQALQRARQLRDEGKRKDAEAIWQGIEELYKDDSSAREILGKIKKDRAGPEREQVNR